MTAPARRCRRSSSADPEAGSDTMKVEPRPSFVVDMDRAAMRLHDPMAEGQPDPGSGADFLGGEERLEDA